MPARLTCLLLVLVACGDDATPAPEDAGGELGDAASEDCIYVAPGAAGDGRASSPFGTIDAALAVADDGDRVCLTGGEHAPPSVPVDVALTFEGLGPAPPAMGATAIRGECRSVLDVPSTWDPSASVPLDVTLEATVAITLENVAVLECDVGLLARAGITVRDSLLARSWEPLVIGAGTAVVQRTSIEPSIRDSETRTGRALIGAYAAPGSTLVLRDEVLVSGGLAGVLAFGADLEMRGAAVESAGFGIYVDGLDAMPLVTLADVEIRDLASLGGDERGNAIWRAEVEVDDLRVRGADVGLGLALSPRARVGDYDFEGRTAVLAQGSALTLDGTLDARSSEGATALVFRSDPTSGTTGAVALEGATTLSISGSEGVGMFVLETDVTASEGSATSFTGGQYGVLTEAATLRFDGPLDLAGAEIGAVVAGSTLDATGGSIVDARFAGLMVLDGSATLRDFDVRDGNIGVVAFDGGTLDVRASRFANLTGGAVEALGDAGDATVTLADLDIDSAAVGVAISGRAATLTGGRIAGCAEGGVRARNAAEITVDGVELRENRGVAVSFDDAAGVVRASTFGGTLPSGGRADEVRLSAETTARTVEVAANQFDLDVARDCSGGTCAVLLFDGAAAVGIVRPNCLVARPAESATVTVVDQGGANVSLLGDATWASDLAGPASDLALGFAAPWPRTAPPALESVDAVLPETTFGR